MKIKGEEVRMVSTKHVIVEVTLKDIGKLLDIGQLYGCEYDDTSILIKLVSETKK